MLSAHNSYIFLGLFSPFPLFLCFAARQCKKSKLLAVLNIIYHIHSCTELLTIRQAQAISIKLRTNVMTLEGKKKLKQSLHRPGQTVRVPGGWSSQISRKLAHEGVKVVSPTYRPHLPPTKYRWYLFLLEAETAPEPWRGKKNYATEKFQWHHWESNHWRVPVQHFQALNYNNSEALVL